MATPALRKHLEQLRAEIARVETTDPGACRALEGVAAEIERMLEESEPDVQSVRDRVEETALGFEASHPRFAQLLSEVTDALAKMGI